MTTISSTKQLLTGTSQGFDFIVHGSVEDVSGAWDGFANDRDIFLSERYLRALELAPPDDMTFYYVVVKRKDAMAGVVYLQLNHFSAKASLNYSRNGQSENGTSGLRRVVRDFVAQQIDFYTLICGNTTISGEHGFIFEESIPEPVYLSIIDEVMNVVRDHAEQAGYDVQLLFVKDFYHRLFKEPAKCAFSPQYNEFRAQPAMRMTLDPAWESMSDYLEALSSKYRVRVRRARKKAGKAKFRPLSGDEIRSREAELYSLYRKIADKAAFNLFVLGKDYFSALKERLGEEFQLYGCFEDGRLIAFYSMIANGEEVEAHFLGYEESVNREHQLYLNMLLNIIECSIEKGFRSIFFARTALEIKSSVGAEPHEMYFYLQHNKGVINKLLPHIFNLLDPKEEWTPRSPFKEED